MSWTGSFHDPIYGGSLYVCTTMIGNQLYGQGSFSELGYMRGIISANNVWTGRFYTCGLEVKQGNFTLQLTDVSSTMTVSGSFFEMPGIVYNFYTAQYSSATPSDIECMKTDSSYLTMNDTSISAPPPYYTGMWTGVDNYGYNQFQYDSGNTAMFSIGDAFGYHPVSYFENQVSPGNWYTNTSNGIELFVLKNATTFYLTWWAVERVADFNFNAQINNPAGHVREYMTMEVSSTGQLLNDVTQAQASSQYCQMLPTHYTLSTCIAAGASGANDDNNNDDDDSNSASHSLTRKQQIGVAIGVIVAFIVGMAVGFVVGQRTANNKLSTTTSKSVTSGRNEVNSPFDIKSQASIEIENGR